MTFADNAFFTLSTKEAYETQVAYLQKTKLRE